MTEALKKFCEAKTIGELVDGLGAMERDLALFHRAMARRRERDRKILAAPMYVNEDDDRITKD